MVNAVVVDGRLEEVRVLLYPALVRKCGEKGGKDLPPGQVEGHPHRHLGGVGDGSC